MTGPALMLASPSSGAPEAVIEQLQAAGTWWFEAKWDGIRACVQRNARGAIVITNRRQSDITHRYPDVVDRFADVEFVGILDGEIICVNEKGRPDFWRAHRRDAQSSPPAIRRTALQYPATFVPFDLLEISGKDVRSEPYTARRMRLATVFAADADVWSIASQDGAAMWGVVKEWELEGLVAKQGNSTYVPTRSRSWLKIKAIKRVSVLVTGYTAGRGTRGTVGALTMVLFDPQAGTLVPVGHVGSGLTERDSRLIAQMLARGEHVVIEVAYLEVSPDGQLRNPVFKGVRSDIPIEECTLSALG